MPVTLKKEKICEGASYTEIIDKRFKTNTLYINLSVKLDKEASPAYSLIIDILHATNEKYPSITAMNRKLYSLYGAGIHCYVFKQGDYQVLSLVSDSIADRYTINRETISSEVIDILLDCLTKPAFENGLFPENEFSRRKQELLDDIDGRINDKRGYAVMRAAETIFKGECAEYPYDGKREYAEKITNENAVSYYKELLKTAYIDVIFSGNAISAEDKEKVFKRIRSLDRECAGEPQIERSPLKSAPEYVTEKMDIAQSKAVMAFKYSYENKYAIRLMSMIFGGTPFSLLFENVREKLSLCYYCAVSSQTKKQVIAVDSGVEHKNIEAAEKEIMRQLEEIKNGNFSDELIKNSMLYLTGALKSAYDSPSALADWYLKERFDETGSPEDMIRSLEKVTKEEIIEAAKSLSLDTVYVLTGKDEE